MQPLIELQLSLTIDPRSGEATAYLLRGDEECQWRWVSDHHFGPFDTVLDVTQWLCRALAKEAPYFVR